MPSISGPEAVEGLVKVLEAWALKDWMVELDDWLDRMDDWMEGSEVKFTVGPPSSRLLSVTSP